MKTFNNKIRNTQEIVEANKCQYILQFQGEMRKKDGMLMDEKNARMKVEQTLLNCMERLTESEERLKRVEASSRENKNALGKVYKCLSYSYIEKKKLSSKLVWSSKKLK